MQEQFLLPGLTSFLGQSCLIGGLWEGQHEIMAEMDVKIRELKSVVYDKDV